MKRMTAGQRADRWRSRLEATPVPRDRLAIALDWLRAEVAAAPPALADRYAETATERLVELAAEINTRPAGVPA